MDKSGLIKALRRMLDTAKLAGRDICSVRVDFLREVAAALGDGEDPKLATLLCGQCAHWMPGPQICGNPKSREYLTWVPPDESCDAYEMHKNAKHATD